MPKVLIVYHSFTGKTKSLAEAAADGARSAGAEVTLLPASEASDEAVATSVAFLKYISHVHTVSGFPV